MKNEIATKTIYLHDYNVSDYLIDTVHLEFELGETVTVVTSRLKIRVNPESNSPNKNLVLQGECLELFSIILNEEVLPSSQYKVDDHSLIIFAVPAECTLTVVTHIKPQENTALCGLYQSSGNFCTQCEAEGFRRITYFLDRPDVMASYKTTIIADETQYPILLSNGNLIEKTKLSNNKHRVTWEDPYKKPCYLFALVAGNLDFIENFYITQSGRRVTLQLYVEKGNTDKAQHAMQALKKAMQWDEENYGREYDLDIYMIVAVSDFNMGAMENKGLNIFNTQYVLAKPETATDMDYVHVESVIGHEYFHNWTGNRITCRDWFQLSLKEGLTVFREQCFTGDITSPTVARIHDVNALRNSQFVEDAGPLAHPVRPDSYVEINNFYTSTIYNKGAEVIRMQKTLLGDELFRKGMDLYFKRHDGQAVTIEDFVKCMEDVSGINLEQFRLWYSQAGTPVLDVTDFYDAASKAYTLKIKQSCPATPNQPDKKPFHIPVKLGLMDEQGHEHLATMLQLKKSYEEYRFENITTKPILSMLREFSAPVKVNYHYSDDDLLTLFMHDKDTFNRWEASQQFAVNFIVRRSNENKALEIPKKYFSVLQHQIKNLQHDKILLSEMLTLPSEKYISEQMSIIKVDAIHEVSQHVLRQIAAHLKQDFIEQYQQHRDFQQPYHYDLTNMSRRQWVGQCLTYLSLLEEKDIFNQFIITHFETALQHNMTDTIAALHCIVNSSFSYKEQALQAFYTKWQHDALVVDKWLTLQAISKQADTLDNVKRLIKHEAFDIKNPNKVYALIASFVYRNPVRFHAMDGAGYQFLTDFVLQLDKINPQIAARMVKPLSEWKRFDETRQTHMRKQLEYLANQKSISKDVNELVIKSLQEERSFA